MNSLFNEMFDKSLTFNGVKRIVMINNNSHYSSDFLIDGVTQIVGSNGSGKTTLLNSILFLYDATAASSIPEHSRIQTENHYFPNNNSFLIFEIQTPENGIIVIGYKGTDFTDNNRNKFERFVYKGCYNKNDYISSFLEDGTPLVKDNTELEAMFVLKDGYLNIKDNKSYYNLISGTNSEYQSLNLVPCRDSLGSKDDYYNFIKIFKNIVNIGKDASQEDLKTMIVESSISGYKNKNKGKLEDYRSEVSLIEKENACIEKDKGNQSRLEKLLERTEILLNVQASLKDNNIRNKSSFVVFVDELKSKISSYADEEEKFKKKKCDFDESSKRNREKFETLIESKAEFIRFIDTYKKKEVLAKGFEEDVSFLNVAHSNLKSKLEKCMFDKILSKKFDETTPFLIDRLARLLSENKESKERLDVMPYIDSLISSEYSKEQANKIFFILNQNGLLKYVDHSDGSSKSNVKELFDKILGYYNDNTFHGFGLCISYDDKKINFSTVIMSPDMIKSDMKLKTKTIKEIENELKIRNDNLDLDKKYNDLSKEISAVFNKIETLNFLSLNLSSYELHVNNLSKVTADLVELKEKEEKERDDYFKIDSIVKNIKIKKHDAKGSILYMESCISLVASEMNFYKSPFQRSDLRCVKDNVKIYSYIEETNNKIKEVNQSKDIIEDHLSVIDIIGLNSDEGYTELRSQIKERLSSLNNRIESFDVSKRKALDSFGTYIDNVFRDVDKLLIPIKSINKHFKSNKKLSNVESVIFRIEHSNNSLYNMLKKYKEVRDNKGELVDYHDILFNMLNKILDFQGGINSVDIKDLFTIKVDIDKSGSQKNSHTTLNHTGSNGTTIVIKLLFYVHLLRKSHSKAGSKFYTLFFIDEVANIDGSNFDKLASVANDLNMLPIVAAVNPITPEAIKIRCYYPSKVELSDGTHRLIINSDYYEEGKAKVHEE